MNTVEVYLNEALRDVALEIRTVDVLELVSNIHADKLGNVGDIVDSALELHFKPRLVCFGYSGSVELGWFGKPSIRLELELHNAGVDAYFCLVIDAMGSSVSLRHLMIDGEVDDAEDVDNRLHAAIEQARLAARWYVSGQHYPSQPGPHGVN